jgi:hypothetical protein
MLKLWEGTAALVNAPIEQAGEATPSARTRGGRRGPTSLFAGQIMIDDEGPRLTKATPLLTATE